VTLEGEQRHKAILLVNADGGIVAGGADPLLRLQVVDVRDEVLVVLQGQTLQVLISGGKKRGLRMGTLQVLRLVANSPSGLPELGALVP